MGDLVEDLKAVKAARKKMIERYNTNFPKVLGQVFQWITNVNDLKSIRLVSKFWRDASLDHWKENFAFVLTHESDPALQQAGDGKDDRFLVQTKPFKNYRFDQKQLWMYVDAPPEVFDRWILKSWESEITSLNLVNEESSLGLFQYEYIRFIGVLLRKCPNLEELTINFIACDKIPEELLDCPVANKLKSLTIHPANGSKLFVNGVDSNRKLMEAYHASLNLLYKLPNLKAYRSVKDGISWQLLWMGMMSKQFIKLESLAVVISNDTTPELIKDYLKFIKEPCLKTLELTIEFKKGPVWKSDGNLRKILNLSQNTLVSLKLRVTRGLDFSMEQFAKIVKGSKLLRLKHFTMIKFSHFDGTFPKFHYELFQAMPNLQTFFFGYENYKMESFKQFNGLISAKPTKDCCKVNNSEREEPVLENLTAFHFFGTINAEILRTVGKDAKNLQLLDIVLDPEMLKVAMEAWPRLGRIGALPGSTVTMMEIYEAGLDVRNYDLRIVKKRKEFTSLLN